MINKKKHEHLPETIRENESILPAQKQFVRLIQLVNDNDLHKKNLPAQTPTLSNKCYRWFKASYFFYCLNLGKQAKFKLQNKHLKLRKTRPHPSYVFRPDSTPRFFWDFFLMLLIFYEMVLIPYRISFDGEQFSFEYSFDFIFLFDILLNLNTAYYNSKAVLIQNRKKILVRYLQFWFWVDLVSSFPYHFILDDQNLNSSASMLRIFRIAKFVRVIRLIRIMKLRIILRKIVAHFNETLLSIYGFFKLSLWILLLAHWLACLWNYVTQSNQAHQWDESPSYNYITCLYWAVTTMLTVGYGDIVPLNSKEYIFAGGAMLFACAVFGYTLNSMSNMLKTSEIEKNDVQAMNRFMKAKKISIKLQISVRKYLEYAEKHKNRFQEDEFAIKLSEALLNNLNYEMKGKLIENCSFFSIFSAELCYRSALELKEQFQSPDEVIFTDKPEELVENSLFFLSKGEVEVFIKETVFKKLKSECIFGEIGFLCDFRTASCRSTDFATLYQLPRSKFLSLLKGKDLEIFCEIKDYMLMYNQCKLDLRCYICQEKGHVAAKCTSLRLLHDKQEINQQLANLLKGFQTNFKRNPQREKKPENTLKSLKRHTLQIITFRMKYKQQIDMFCLQYKDTYENQILLSENFSEDDDSGSGGDSYLWRKRGSYSNIGFKSLAVKMLAVNDKIDLDDYEMDRAKTNFKDYEYFQKLQEFETIQNFQYYFVHNNFQ